MKCPRCEAFIIFGNLSFSDYRIYSCCNCGFTSDNLKDFWKKEEDKDKK